MSDSFLQRAAQARGVLSAEVLLEQEAVVVVFDPLQIKPGALVQAVAAAGNDGHHCCRAQLAG